MDALGVILIVAGIVLIVTTYTESTGQLIEVLLA